MDSGINPSEIFKSCQPVLYRVAVKMLKNKQDAEDVVQETFAKWLVISKENINNTKAYLVRGVMNNCINYLKSSRVVHTTSLNDIHDQELSSAEEDRSPMEMEQMLHTALNVLKTKLEPMERSVYVLREIFDFDYQSLQELLNKKQDNCRQMLCRAKKKLEEEKELLSQKLEPVKESVLEAFRKATEANHPSDIVRLLSFE